MCCLHSIGSSAKIYKVLVGHRKQGTEQVGDISMEGVWKNPGPKDWALEDLPLLTSPSVLLVLISTSNMNDWTIITSLFIYTLFIPVVMLEGGDSGGNQICPFFSDYMEYLKDRS